MTRRPDYCSVYIQAIMVFIVAVATLYVGALLLLAGTEVSAFVTRLAPVTEGAERANIGITCVRCLIPLVGATLISVLAYRCFLRQAQERINR